MARENQTRKHPVHGILDVDGQPTIIFDTVCTKDRSPWLANRGVHDLLRSIWATDATAWAMGKYIVLPDHIHFFAGATGDTVPYENWVRYWKSQFTKRHKIAEHTWQVDHWDTRIRSCSVYEQKWEYVRMNSVRHGYVDSPEQWLYQGQIHQLHWD